MGSASWKVKDWRKRTKQKLIDGFGGKCNKCGYNKYYGALDLHHKNPKEKSFGFSAALASPISWDKLLDEAKKCVLLCGNCHQELHGGLWTLEEIDIVEFQGQEQCFKKDTITGKCVVCEVDVYMGRICCSLECAGKRASKVCWPSKSDFQKLLRNNSIAELSMKFNVSEAAVRKRKKKYNL